MLLGVPLQTAYVTTDIARACTMLGDKYGMTQFLRYGPATFPTDAGESMTLNLAHGWLGSTWFEIIEPVAGAVAIYRDWLPADGFGLRFHHIGIRLPDLDTWDRTKKSAEKTGHPVVFTMTSKDLPSRVFYIDTVKDLGHYIEYLYFSDVAKSTLPKIPQNIKGFEAVY